MSETYCGKNCDDCRYSRDLNCPGCKAAGQHDCPIARCCRSSRRESCCSCAVQGRCATVQVKERIPKDRLTRQNEARASREESLARGRFLRKLMWVLLVLSVPDGIAFLLSTNLGLWLAPSLSEQMPLIAIVIRLMIGILLLIMGTGESCYRTAGWFTLAGALIGTVPGLLSDIGYAVLILTGEYFLFSAHEAVMDGRSENLSHFWGNLWKWRVLICIDIVSAAVMRAVSGLPPMLTVLIYSAYLAVSALGYILLLTQLWEQQRGGNGSRTVVVFHSKLPIKLIHMDYFGTTLVVVLLVAFGLLKYMTMFLTLLTTVLIPIFLLRTVRNLPTDPNP